MKNRGTHEAIAKITTPITYRDLAQAIENMRSKLAKEGMPQNKIEKKIDSLKTRGQKGALEDTWNSALAFFGNALLSQSAQQIYLVDMGYLTEQVIYTMPKFLKTRIVWADKDKKIQNLIFKIVDPIFEEIEPAWDRIRSKTGIQSVEINGHEHGLCLLLEFLVTMAVASKYETEADADPYLVRGAINRLHTQVKSPESLALLSRVEGVLNCYQISQRIPGLKSTKPPIPGDLLRDLLDDARIISLSKSRYLLGIPGRFEIAMIRMKQKLREVLSDRRNRENLAIASKIGNIATKHYNFEIPEMGNEPTKGFTPPLVSLQKMKPPCISTMRQLPTVRPPKIQ